MRKWYAGVTHSHTTVSDGSLTYDGLADMAVKKNLDFLIITDHNRNVTAPLPVREGLTVIPGVEMSFHGGHCNLWGVAEPIKSEYRAESYEEWLALCREARENGAFVSLNHPFCSKCTWRWEMDITKFDVLEVWNSPQHYDNMVCADWWQELLAGGLQVPVVGGSDYHRDYLHLTKLLDWPTTFVYADSPKSEDILAAIVAGRTSIASGVKATFIELSSGEAGIGDTVEFKPGTQVTVKVRGLKRGHTLMLYGAEGVFYTYTAKRSGDFAASVPVRSAGFVRAEVRHNLGRIYKAGYNAVIGRSIPSQKGMPLPPFIYAMTGAIYFK